MPKNPFAPSEGEFRLPRNQVDLSERRLFTSDFGKLMPFFLREVIPGQSVEIDSTVGLRGMPTVFPVQTRMRMSVEYYYCRNRCVWPDFEDFIFKTKDNLVAPWLKMNNDRAKVMISTGSLGDMFRVASTIGSNCEISKPWFYFDRLVSLNISPQYFNNQADFFVFGKSLLTYYGTTLSSTFFVDTPTTSTYSSTLTGSIAISSRLHACPSDFSLLKFTTNVDVPTASYNNYVCYAVYVGGVLHPQLFDATMNFKSYEISFGISESFYSYLNSLDYVGTDVRIAICLFDSYGSTEESPRSYLTFLSNANAMQFKYFGVSRNIIFSPSQSQLFPSSSVIDSTDDSVISSNPYIGSSPSEKINALPFRHYEMICNYYYRNDKNNPIVYNGQVEYNKFIPTKEGGADENLYDFHYRNFELDMFTSATQSPQFGEAPLVGLTYNPTGEHATLSFSATNEAGETHTYKATVGLDDDGTLKDIANFDADIPSANLRRLQDAINYGISINDFRLGNSFQRFKENVLRRGMRYRNQLLSHFGVSVDYPDIDIPQYIGGISGLIEPGQVTNTGNDPNSGLGSFVGTLQGGVSTQHKIRCFCPEHGFIIGIVSFYPIPMYCQNTDSVMLKRDAFDYYQAEFGKIGFVPITYSEVFPLQVPAGASRSDVFGYQKAWYSYLRSYDSVHGDFRTTLRDFALMRTFSQRPVLGRDFTEVHPEQFNDIFVANNVADANGSDAKFMLSSSVHCISKVPIPVFGTPSLE